MLHIHLLYWDTAKTKASPPTLHYLSSTNLSVRREIFLPCELSFWSFLVRENVCIHYLINTLLFGPKSSPEVFIIPPYTRLPQSLGTRIAILQIVT